MKHKNTTKNISIGLLLVFLWEILSPTAAYALTGGPSQPEVESFEPIGTNQMVDPFTGDFTYNIPLMDVGGYPINISYHSGITMDQEASWVGLGWNINPGVINRNMRGLPDDFNGDVVTNEFNMKKNETFGLTTKAGFELFGVNPDKFLSLNASLGYGITYNTYDGFGIDAMAGIQPSLSIKKSCEEIGTLGLGLNMTASSNNGLNTGMTASYSYKMNVNNKINSLDGNIGIGANSRQGLNSLSVSASAYGGDKLEQKDGNYGIGSSVSFFPNTYTPTQKSSFESGNYSASVKLGPHVLGGDISIDLIGSYAYQKIKDKKVVTSSFGYNNLENAAGNDKALLDFNREKDGSFTQHSPLLPLTNLTYDLFGISGHGTGGMFRSHRGDVGHVHDAKVKNTSNSGNLGFEFGVGNIVKFGVDGHFNNVTSSSGTWGKENEARDYVQYKPKTSGNLYEPHYYRMIGDKTSDAFGSGPAQIESWKSALDGDTPLRISLTGDGYAVTAENKYITKGGTPLAISQVKRTSRARRSQVISTLSSKEVQDGMGVGDYYSQWAAPHHIGEVSVLGIDGSRYIYGLPAYNFKQKEVTFNVSGNGGKNCATGLITYTDTDASTKNEKGRNEYYQSTETPGYAHSFLLTSLLSADYSDYDDIKGPSIGDFGSYVSFEYDQISRYKWRVPFEGMRASYNEGLKSDASDDMGSYIYGEKELFYLKIIKSKTHVAVFYTSNRDDAFGVLSENGQGKSTPMKKLDKIELYSLNEYMLNENNLSLATPIKTVHFTYDYSLCPGIPNRANGTSGTGKLTLKEIYFTYGKSFKAKFSPYKFSYADLDHNGQIDNDANPSYNLKGYDRWGHYKPNLGGCNLNDIISSAEYPYVEQNKTNTDIYQAAWTLTDIHLPSGSNIMIDYESDDYAYVQDKKAMQMFQVVGAGNTESLSFSNSLYDSDNNTNRYLYFQLNETKPDGTPDSELAEEYFGDIMDNRLYYRFLVALNDELEDGNVDYISGYAEIEQVGLVDNGGQDHEYGFIKIKEVKKGDKRSDNKNAHPISRSAWNFARMYNPEIAFNAGNKHASSKPAKLEPEDIFLEIWDMYSALGEAFQGPNGKLRRNGYGKKFKIGKSWIRLYNPSGKKLGGGIRVKKIAISDNWNLMALSGSKAEYGQVYSYVLQDGRSSGVASYEPAIGGDENPFKIPIYYSVEGTGAFSPNGEDYVETPFGESFFPSPGVGYSRVTVKSEEYMNVTQNATGYTIHEFFTAKDFPTITEDTGVKPKYKPASFAAKMLKFSVKEHLEASQGFVIQTNDMHGKMKMTSTYSANDKLISSTEHIYKTTNQTVPNSHASKYQGSRKILQNEVPMLFSDNLVSNKELGVTYEMVNDFRKSETSSYSGGLMFNTSTFLAAILPFAIPTILPSYSRSYNQFRSAATTKLINRYGVLEKVITLNGNSEIIAENQLWDPETGEVLLTKVQNEYDDPIYQFTYPAHWTYERMSGAYKNIGYTEDITVSNSDGFFYPDRHLPHCKFELGDELMLIDDQELVSKAWVWGTQDNNDLHLIDKRGEVIRNGLYTAKVIRSGYRNMSSTPTSQVILKENPIVNNTIVLNKDSQFDPKIINANAQTFSEEWAMREPLIDRESETSYILAENCDCPDEDPVNPEEVYIDAFINLLRGLVNEHKIDGTYKKINLTQESLFGFSQTVDLPLLQNSLITPFTGNFFLTISYEDRTCATPPFTSGPWFRDYPFLIFTFHNNDRSISHEAAFRIFINFDLSELNEDPIGILYEQHLRSGRGYCQERISIGSDFQISSNYPLVSVSGYNGIRFEDQMNSLPFKTRSCPKYFTIECPQSPIESSGANANPYVLGIRGNWRPDKNYTYLSDRSYSSGLPEVRNDGTYSSFDPFWVFNSAWNRNLTAATAQNWKEVGTITKYDEFGNEVENRNVLGIYSSAVFDPTGNLVTSVGNNAQYGQLAYDGFEFYDQAIPTCPENEYFGIAEELDDPNLNYTLASTAHTGKKSLLHPSQGIITYNLDFDTRTKTGGQDDVPYTIKVKDRLGTFGNYEAELNHDFIISFWVKENTADIRSDFDDVTVSINGTNLTLYNSSNIIEGWQKYEYKFPITGNSSSQVLIDFNNNSTNDYFIDDLRIYPVDASMKSFVYDTNNMRFIAELDENNFATWYEYDEEGKLIRVKKETIRGIETIQENRNHISSIQP